MSPEEQITEEDLKRLSPGERIRVLRDLEERKRKELEEQRKKMEGEIRAAETMLKESEEELEESVGRAEERVRKQEEPPRKEEDLEKKLADVKVPEQQASGYKTGAEYRTGPGLEDVTQLYRLGPRERSGEERELYQTELYKDGEKRGNIMEEGYMAPSQQREGMSTNILKEMYRH